MHLERAVQAYMSWLINLHFILIMYGTCNIQLTTLLIKPMFYLFTYFNLALIYIDEMFFRLYQ